MFLPGGELVVAKGGPLLRPGADVHVRADGGVEDDRGQVFAQGETP